jgi:probable selenium-dependent hydroxylase accessory protein YqeC
VPPAVALGLQPGDRVAVLGSGGKTTLLRRLAREAAGDVILTTTTRMAPPGAPGDPRFVPFHGSEQFAAVWAGLAAPRRVLTGRFQPGEAKLAGLSPAEVEALAGLPGLDLLVVEADGSRGLPAKAHASHEPVLFPGCTLGVAVLGMRALGLPVGEGQVHRAHLMLERYGWSEGRCLDLGDLERLAASYLDLLPRGRRVLVLSQAEAVTRQSVLDLAGRLRNRADRVVAQTPDWLEVLA